MNKFTFGLILFLTSCLIKANAQPYETDSASSESINKQGEELYFKAQTLHDKGEFAASIPYYEQALILFKHIDSYYNIAAVASGLGKAYMHISQYQKAIEKFKISIGLFLQECDTVNALHNLLDLKKCFVATVQQKEILFVDSTFYAIIGSLNNDSLKSKTYFWLAENMYNESNYQEACRLYQKYLDLNPSIESLEEYNKVYTAYHHIALSYYTLGDWKKSIQWGNNSLGLQSSTHYNLTDKISTYIMMVGAYSMISDTTRTEQCIDSLFDITKDEWSLPQKMCEKHMTASSAYNRLKLYDKALYHCDKAIIFAGEINNTNFLANIHLQKSAIYNNLERYVQSADELQKYINLKEETGGNWYNYYKTMYYLASVRGFAGQIEEGQKVVVKMLHGISNMIDTQFKYVSSESRENFWGQYANILNNTLKYNLSNGNPQDSFTEELYNTLLYCKGMLLSSEKQTSEIIKLKGSEEDIQCYEQLNKYRSDYESLSQHPKGHEEELATLFASIQSMDKKLTDHISSYGNVAAFTKVKYQNVKNALQDSEAIIDIAVVEGQYLAFIVRKQDEHPIRIKLFTQAQLDSLKSAKGASLDALYEYDENLSTIKLCWQSFEKYLKDCRKVYYVPAGDMHSVAFESLPISQDSLLSDKYQIIRLSSAREICKKEVKNSYKNAVLYGGLNYTVDEELMAKNSHATSIPTNNLLAMRGGPAFGDSIFSDLKSTKKEVESIQKILKKQHVKTQVLSEDKGTSESFFSLSGNAPSLIHLATHGFYYTPEDGHSVAGLKNVKSAMQLSGVILSGGNAGWLGKKLPEGTLGGVLTASDISRIDLENVKLVCLSACETAKGKVTSDGVYGLQRAFKKAGVQSIVMSLWNVSDWATTELMIYFYQALADNSWNSHEAMEVAKSKMRLKYPEPFYWAGFIVMD